MTKATFVPTSAPIDLTDWTWLAGPGPNGANNPHPADPILGKIVGPIIAGEFEKDPPQVSLPFEWVESDGNNGPPVLDPLTIDIELPLGDDDCNCPTWRISFKELVDDLVEMYVLTTGPDFITARSPPFFEEDGIALLGKLANALRDEADRIEAIIERGPLAK